MANIKMSTVVALGVLAALAATARTNGIDPAVEQPAPAVEQLVDQPDAPTGNAGGTVGDSSTKAYTFVKCDENNVAFDVEPDTDAARADAQAWCASSGEWIDQAPWPGGFHP